MMTEKTSQKQESECEDQISHALQSSAEETAAFSAISEWGFERLKASIDSRGDTFDRAGAVAFEEDGCEVLRIPVSCMPATIGCGRAADYIMTRTGISRLHCHLECVGNLVRLYDDSSTNGVYLNRKKIEREDLCDGDEVTLGSVSLRVRKV